MKILRVKRTIFVISRNQNFIGVKIISETAKTESQKLGEQILESLRKQGVPIPGEPSTPPEFDKIFEEVFKRK